MIKCLGSGSSGNGWVIDDGKDILIIDCGIPVSEMLIGINFEINRVVGCCVTHCHTDHTKFLKQYEQRNLKIFKPYEDGRTLVRFGGFLIQAFPLVHDVSCFGFHIRNEQMGTILYATDTEYIKYRFKDLNHIIVEANYSNELVEDDPLSVKLPHVFRGHMELSTTKRFLRENCKIETQNVILAHLSAENADRDKFLTEVQPLVGCPVWIAKKGLVIDTDTT